VLQFIWLSLFAFLSRICIYNENGTWPNTHIRNKLMLFSYLEFKYRHVRHVLFAFKLSACVYVQIVSSQNYMLSDCTYTQFHNVEIWTILTSKSTVYCSHLLLTKYGSMNLIQYKLSSVCVIVPTKVLLLFLNVFNMMMYTHTHIIWYNYIMLTGISDVSFNVLTCITVPIIVYCADYDTVS
jgi:hypothetical protein